MTDYNKQKVADLRTILKDRGIPSTGLTRKAQIIEKLEEYDRDHANEATESAGEPDGGAQDVVAEANGDDVAPSEELSSAQIETAGAVQPEAPAAEAQEDTRAEHTPEATDQDEAGETQEARPVSEIVAPEDPESSELPQKVTAPEIIPQSADAIMADSEAADQEPPSVIIERGPEPIDPVEPAHPPEKTKSVAIVETSAESKDRTPSSVPSEQTSIEKPELLPIPELSVGGSVEASRVPTEEREADTKKRKRRSVSPELPTQDVRAKKPRPSDVAAPDVHLKEDTDTVMEQRQPDEERKESNEEGMNGVEQLDAKEADIAAPEPETKTSPTPEPKALMPERKEKSDRYKGLLQPSAPEDITETAAIDDRPTAPALHHATPALYIRDFMRPLRLEALRTHLISLASPPSGSPDPSLLKSLFIDNMKTHALVLFTSTTAASRVRASIHGSIWPAESKRKALWADFVPEDKVLSWVQEEEDDIASSKSTRRSARKFEVVYPVSESGSVEAVFQEVGSSAPANAPRGPRNAFERRFSEREVDDHEAQSRVPAPLSPVKPQDQSQSFRTLDELFDSTTAKPKLYFLPVSDEIAKRRLDDLDAETSRDWRPEERVRGRGRGRLDEKVRFSFDDDDRVVEAGGDFGPWTEEFVGAGGGGGGYRGRGGFRGRGEWRGGFRGAGGGSWRG